MIGIRQWTCRPTPSRAAPCAKPAPSQVDLICPHGPCGWFDTANTCDVITKKIRPIATTVHRVRCILVSLCRTIFRARDEETQQSWQAVTHALPLKRKLVSTSRSILRRRSSSAPNRTGLDKVAMVSSCGSAAAYTPMKSPSTTAAHEPTPASVP
jgi:hypothetical protein